MSRVMGIDEQNRRTEEIHQDAIKGISNIAKEIKSIEAAKSVTKASYSWILSWIIASLFAVPLLLFIAWVLQKCWPKADSVENPTTDHRSVSARPRRRVESLAHVRRRAERGRSR